MGTYIKIVVFGGVLLLYVFYVQNMQSSAIVQLESLKQTYANIDVVAARAVQP